MMDDFNLHGLIREALTEFSLHRVQGKRSKKAKAITRPSTIENVTWTFIYDAVKIATDKYFELHPQQDSIPNRKKKSKQYAIEFARMYKDMGSAQDWQRFMRKKLKLRENKNGP